jgi:hypothetical protein
LSIFIRFRKFLNIEFGFLRLLHKIADLRSKCNIFLNILIGFEIFVKFSLLHELGLIKNTQAGKKRIFRIL